MCVYLQYSTVVLCKFDDGAIIIGVSHSIQHWVIMLLYKALYCCDELSRLNPLVMESGLVDWHGGRALSAFRSQISAGWSQNLVGRDRELMGSYIRVDRAGTVWLLGGIVQLLLLWRRRV